MVSACCVQFSYCLGINEEVQTFYGKLWFTFYDKIQNTMIAFFPMTVYDGTLFAGDMQ